jgi:hypothetical protein
MRSVVTQQMSAFVVSLVVVLVPLPVLADTSVRGRVEGAGKPIVDASVTLWAAGTGAPRKLGEARTNTDGGFELTASAESESSSAAVLYLLAEGGAIAMRTGTAANPALELMTILREMPRDPVTINELTTVASVWTAAQFLDGTSLSGNPLGLRIAAGNVPNFVDLTTGGLGPVIQDPLNSSQTTTLAKINTLGILLSAWCQRDTESVRQALLGRQAARWRDSRRHALRSREHRAASVASGR